MPLSPMEEGLVTSVTEDVEVEVSVVDVEIVAASVTEETGWEEDTAALVIC
jgi:hypothetical protein